MTEKWYSEIIKYSGMEQMILATVRKGEEECILTMT